MIYGSVCSGIEAATVAWHPLGWSCAFVSEIESFPRAVLKHRWPEIPLHGDFTTIQARDYRPIGLLVGGTPCQSFSVAGLRGGLDDERGNLALEYLRLADRLRPRWLVWENVPGVLSSNGGRDFGAILGGMVELGYGFAYRVLDAQFLGVPQRRRRVFVVGYLGDWRRAAAVLFERHSLSGNPAPRREAGQSSPTLPSRSSAGGGLGTDFDCDGGLIASALDYTNGLIGEVAGTIEAAQAKGNRGQGVLYSIMPQNSGRDYKARAVEVAQPIMAGGPVSGNQGGDVLVQSLGFNSREDCCCTGDVAGSLGSSSPQSQAVAFNLRGREGGAMPEADDLASMRAASGGSSRSYLAFAQNTRDEVRLQGGDGQICGALGADEGMKQRTYIAASAVRRLTPRECERLQGFPDDYTLIPWRKGEAPDGPRYKALGNSMAVPVMAWIGRRIEAVEALTSTSQVAA